jgi:hypothetical protein
LQTSAFYIFRKIHRELPKFQENKVLKILFFNLQETDGLRSILARNYQENSQAKPKNITLVSIATRQEAKHDQAEFQPATQTDLD